MRFLVDECTGPSVARWLHSQGHTVFSVFDEARGMRDEQIIQKAFVENWILITIVKDFGESIYRDGHPHHGVILLRLEDERASNKIDIIQRLLAAYAGELVDRYVVVTEKRVRFARQIKK